MLKHSIVDLGMEKMVVETMVLMLAIQGYGSYKGKRFFAIVQRIVIFC